MCDRSQADKDHRYTWRDLVITAAELQHMTEKELIARERRCRRIFKIMQADADTDERT